jgi:hypothetical protein
MKKHLLVIGIIFLFVGMSFQPAFANDVSLGIENQQPRGATFIKTFEGNCAYSVQQTTDDGYILTGYIGNAALLIKTDITGNKEWDKTYVGEGMNRAISRSVQQTTDGGYIITGDHYFTFDGDINGFLFKTDSNGNLLWEKTIGGGLHEEGHCVQQTIDGGYIISGRKEISTGSYYDVWLFKTDSNGNKEWDKTFGEGIGYCVQQTTDGGYIIVDGNRLIKTNSAGIKEWAKSFGSFKGYYCVQQTSDGGYIITGDTWLWNTLENVCGKCLVD